MNDSVIGGRGAGPGAGPGDGPGAGLTGEPGRGSEAGTTGVGSAEASILPASLMRPELVGRTAYGAPQLDVPVRLNTNENSFAVPDAVAEAMGAEIRRLAGSLNRYPDRDFTALREDLAAYLTRSTGAPVRADQVWAANGSNEVLLHLMQAFAGPDRILMGVTPSYSMYPNYALSTGTTWVGRPRAGHADVRAAGDGVGETRASDGDAKESFALDPQVLAAQIREVDPHVLVLASPDNPTGTAVPLEVVEAAYAASPRAIVVVDEAYAEFSRPGTPSAVTLLPGRPRLVVTRTLSKAFAFAGGRLGYLTADPALIEALRLVRLPYHLSEPTQALARVALAHADLMLAQVDQIVQQRDRIVREAAALGLPVHPSDANFVLIGGFPDQAAAWQALLDEGVLVRDVGLPGHLRVTAGTPEETSAFLAALAKVVTATKAGQA